MLNIMNKFVAVKKNYYRLARMYHPDRVAANEKEEANEKFNVIHNAYCILSDAAKKKLYDSCSNVLFTKATFSAQWEIFLNPVDSNAIDKAREIYQGTSMEKSDLIRECIIGKGSMTHMLNNIPFMRVEDEMRVIEIIKHLIDKGEIPKMQLKKLKK